MKIFSVLFLIIISGCSTNRPFQVTATTVEVDENLLQEIQQQSRRGRVPASINTSEPQITAKRVYFRSLYGQFLTYQKLSGKTTGPEHCPAFHHDFISMTPQTEMMNTKIATTHGLVETEKEIKELCEKGISANYYRFENLVTYHTNKEAFHLTPKSFFALMKIPVFKNMYELRVKNNIQSTPTELTNLTRTHWFSAYLERQQKDEKVISLRN